MWAGDKGGCRGEGQPLLYSLLSLWCGIGSRRQPLPWATCRTAVTWGSFRRLHHWPRPDSSHAHTHAHAHKGQLLENGPWRPQVTIQPSLSENTVLHPTGQRETRGCSSAAGKMSRPSADISTKVLNPHHDPGKTMWQMGKLRLGVGVGEHNLPKAT